MKYATFLAVTLAVMGRLHNTILHTFQLSPKNLFLGKKLLEHRYVIYNLDIITNSCETVIYFSLVEPTQLTIRILALDGREIHCYTNFYNQGTHIYRVVVPAGVYTFWLETPSDKLIRKVAIQ